MFSLHLFVGLLIAYCSAPNIPCILMKGKRETI